jgi:hypothetical protein
MVWINLFLAITTSIASELPKFFTKHPAESLRFISMDGRLAYVVKRPGVLGLVSSFRTIDFLSDSEQSNFLITSSRFKTKLIIEVVPAIHTEYALQKSHKIYAITYGQSNPQEVGLGRAPRLHLNDEWISYYQPIEKTITLQNLKTQKKINIKTLRKANPFFTPEVEMLDQNVVIYTDINEAGYSALVAYNLLTGTSSIIYKAQQNATRLELCQNKSYLALGEFPYEGASRGSQILQLKLTGQTNLAAFTTAYDSVDQDIGNLICLPEAIYFIKTVSQEKNLFIKTTDVVKLDLKSNKVESKSSMGNITQLVEMDGRVLVPLRGEFFVVEGSSNLGTDVLKSIPNKEELQLDL